MASRAEERGRYSGGLWQDRVRCEAAALCREGGLRALEIGCGEGLFLTRLAEDRRDMEIWGIDNNRARLAEAKKRAAEKELKNIHLLSGEGARPPFGGGYFDVIICINTFFNMESADSVNRTLFQMRRLCKKNGRIIFDFRNSMNKMLVLKYRLARYYDETVMDLPLKTFELGYIESLIRDIGFKVISKRYIPGLFGKGWLKVIAPIIIIEAQEDAG